MTPLADEVDTNVYDIHGEEGEHQSWIEGRRARLAAGTVAAVIVAGLAFAGISQTSALAIEEVRVSGNSHLTPDDVVKASGVRTGKSIVTINTASIEGKLEKQPWIDDATVSRDWPNLVKIAVVERRAVMQAQTGEKKWAQIGEGGKVLSVTDGLATGLPVPLGVTAPSQPGAQLDASAANLLNIASALPKSLQGQVSQIQQEGDQFRLGLSAGTIIELGDLRDLGDKLMAAAAVLKDTDPKTLSVLDVRSPHLPIATPKNAPTTVAAAPPTTAAKSSSSSTTTPKSSTSTTVRRSTTTTTR